MTITIDLAEEKSLKLSNKTAWAMYYRDQFGIDIIPTLMPMIAAAFALIGEIAATTERSEEIEWEQVSELVNSDSMAEALIKLSGFEFVDFLNITWALAKAADPNIEEPKKWILEFDEFPLDIIGPEVVNLIFKGLVSTKKVEWLQEKLNGIKVSLQPTLEKLTK